MILMFTGSSFHNLGAAYAKLRHPNLRRAFGMMSKLNKSEVKVYKKPVSWSLRSSIFS